jgi:hypothetical protein
MQAQARLLEDELMAKLTAEIEPAALFPVAADRRAFADDHHLRPVRHECRRHSARRKPARLLDSVVITAVIAGAVLLYWAERAAAGCDHAVLRDPASIDHV